MATPDELVVTMFVDLAKRTTPLTTELRNRLIRKFEPEAHPHIVLIRVVETLYRHRDTYPAQWLTYAADASEAMAAAGFPHMLAENRGTRIAAALRKLPGVVTPPTPTGDPEPQAEA